MQPVGRSVSVWCPTLMPGDGRQRAVGAVDAGVRRTAPGRAALDEARAADRHADEPEPGPHLQHPGCAIVERMRKLSALLGLILLVGRLLGTCMRRADSDSAASGRGPRSHAVGRAHADRRAAGDRRRRRPGAHAGRCRPTSTRGGRRARRARS